MKTQTLLFAASLFVLQFTGRCTVIADPPLRFGSIELVDGASDPEFRRLEEFGRAVRVILSAKFRQHELENPDDMMTNSEAFMVTETLDRFTEWCKRENRSIQLVGARSGQFGSLSLQELYYHYYSVTFADHPVLAAHLAVIQDALASQQGLPPGTPLDASSQSQTRRAYIAYIAAMAAGITDRLTVEKIMRALPTARTTPDTWEQLKHLKFPIYDGEVVNPLWRYTFLFEADDVERFRSNRIKNEMLRLTLTLRQFFVYEEYSGPTPEERAGRTRWGDGPTLRPIRKRTDADLVGFVGKMIDFLKIPELQNRGISNDQALGVIAFMVKNPGADFNQVQSASKSAAWTNGKPIKNFPKSAYSRLREQTQFWLRSMLMSGGLEHCAQKLAHLAPR